MRKNRLGCLSGTGMIAVFITALSIAGYAFASGGVMFSPGPLNAIPGRSLGGVTSHAEINGNCSACHGAPWEAATMDDRCSVCHANVAEEMKDPESMHGRMMQIDPNAQCRDCHPEHNGADAALTVLEGWRFPHEVVGYSLNGHQLTAAKEPFLCSDCHRNDVTTFDQVTCRQCHGQIDMAFMIDHAVTFGETCLNCHDGGDRFGNDFDHNIFAFSLTGKHAAVACSKCHMSQHTLVALQAAPQDCFSCHQFNDPHQGGLGTDCAACHTTDDWQTAHFDHDRAAFKLVGAHVNVTCENCHLNGVYRGTPMDCFSCHKEKDPHQGQLGNDCAACHNATDWKAVSFDHSATSFPLVGKHVDVTCVSCHKNGVYKGTPQDCFSCHLAADVHKGQFGTDCARCHNPGSWKDVSFDHSRTDFPLTGLHKNVLCAACHLNGVFKGTPKDCFSCHAVKDIHKGQFGTKCSECHNTSGWKNVSFDHSKTAFSLTGTHSTVACKSCHVNNVFKGTPKDCFSCHAAKDIHNGQFGTNCSSCHKPTKWSDVIFDHSKTAFPLNGLHTNVACKSCHVNNVYKGTPKDCFSCHAAKDIHQGQFGTKCSECHNTSGWKNVTFDHGKTAFPLTAAHSTVACKSCHVNNVYKGTPKDCFSCHAARDVHKGQFGTNCSSCHKTTRWSDVTFNHNKTAFPLSGLHTNVACTACHINNVYKGTPRDCFSCHARRDIHNGQFGTVCSTCHTTTGWKNVTFNHSNTAFPLSGAHTNAACQACHKNNVYKGTPRDCYSCHAARDAHNGQFGTNCASCHKTTRWAEVTFNHNNTAFPLVGRHAGVQCKACHANGYKGTPTNCVACHANDDKHNGQFGTNCGSCHTPNGWGNATFDHNNTAFPLVGKHKKLECQKCHRNGVYQGTPSQCVACHEDKHKGENGTDCAACHTPTNWDDAKKGQGLLNFLMRMELKHYRN